MMMYEWINYVIMRNVLVFNIMKDGIVYLMVQEHLYKVYDTSRIVESLICT